MIAFLLLIIVTAAMAAISLAVAGGESSTLYSSPLMCLLWAALASAGLLTIIRRNLWKRPASFLLHISLIMILAGAGVTHFCGSSESIHLRISDSDACMKSGDLEIKAVSYETAYYPGTSTPMDYRASIELGPAAANGNKKQINLSLNKVAEYEGGKYILQSVDSDSEGFTIKIRRDAPGTYISFTAYGLLLPSMILYFFERRSGLRQIISRLNRLSGVAILVLTGILSPTEISAMKIPQPTIESFASIQALHNGRVTTLYTVANDFTATLTGGKTSWKGHPAEEIMAGYLFDFSSWKRARLIKVKDQEMRKILGIKGKKATYEEYMKAVTQGRLDLSDPSVALKYADDIGRFESITRLLTGELLKIFPLRRGEATEWLTPASKLPPEIESKQWLLLKRSMAVVNQSILTHKWDDATKMMSIVSDYQEGVIGHGPDREMIKLERIYHQYGRSGWLAVTAIMAGIIIIAIGISRKSSKKRVRYTIAILIPAIWIMLTLLICLRWRISGHLPMANGFETMQFMGWIMLGIASVSVITNRKGGLLWCGLSTLGAGLTLAVAAMSGEAGSISALMPVLSSPLLSMHVACVMGAYSLLLLMALSSIGYLLIRDRERCIRLTLLSRALQYPALFLLAAGIFIGAIWADISWGDYWSWDPKEVWALITMLIYSLPLHPGILRKFNDDRIYNLYIGIAFFSVLITYFGVNFYLGGMHSYA